MLETGLDNELLTLDTGFENSAMAAENSTAPQGNPYHQYTLGEDGNWYRDGERVYYWVPSAETDSTIDSGGETQGIGQDLGGYYTEAEIKAAYDSDSVLGEQTGGWDNYWGFISERQAEIQAGNLVDPIQADFAGQAAAYAAENTDADAEIANTGRDEEIYYAQSDANEQTAFLNQMSGWVDQNAALMNKYGIAGAYQNDDGDVYAFNGSTYSRTYKAEGADWGQVFAGVMIGAFTGNVVGGLVNAAGGAYFGAGWSNVIGNILGGGAGASAGDAAYNNMFNPNVIVNLAGSDLNDQGGYTQPGINNEDGTSRYGSHNLPEGYIYNEARNAVIHVASGKEYPVTVGMYDWYVSLPNTDDEDGGAGDTTSSNTNTNTNTNTTTTTSSSGGNNPGGTYEGRVLTNKTYGDITIDDRDVWGEGDEYAGWVLVSNTGVWGQSGISVIYNPGTGFYQEIDWDNGTYDQQMKDSDENPNPFDTTGTNSSSASTSGTTTTPSSSTPAEGDACDLGGGNTGVIKDGKCVATSATLPNTGLWPSSTRPNSTGEPPPTSTTSTTSTTTTQSPSTTPTTTTTPSTNTSSSNQPAGEIVGTGVWPASGTGGGTGAGNGPEGSGDGDNGGDGDGNGGDGNGNGNGLSTLAASRGSSKLHWDRLFAAKEFERRRGQFGRPTGTSRELNSSNYQMRQNLIKNLWDDLA